MNNVLPFKRKQPPKRSLLCSNGHHRWVIWQQKPFDTRQGRLITVYRCERCGAEKTQGE